MLQKEYIGNGFALFQKYFGKDFTLEMPWEIRFPTGMH